MVYNVGSHDLPLGEIGTKVNDNQYHIVRFQRFGGNATLQLDDYNVQTVHPQGNKHICIGQKQFGIRCFPSLAVSLRSAIHSYLSCIFPLLDTIVHISRSSIDCIQLHVKHTSRR